MLSDPTIHKLSASWPALLLASLILLPWLGKAHTIDDTTFLLQAEHILKDPLHPTAFEMVSDGNWIRLSSQLVSGPVMAYLLVPSILLGGAEWAAHLVQYLLMLVAILATVSLTFRLGLDRRGAQIAGLLLTSTPAVMVMTTTSMPDVPAMAFAVLGMERFFAWKQVRQWHQCLASAVSFALAALSRPHLILILPVAVTFECASLFSPFRKASPYKPSHVGQTLKSWSRMKCALLLLIPLALAALITVVAIVVTADPVCAGGDIIRAALSRLHSVKLVPNTASFFLHWTLVFPLALLWIWMRVRWKHLWCNPTLWLVLPVLIFVATSQRNNDWLLAVVLELALVGAVIILDIFLDAWLRRDRVQLFLGAWLLIALPAIGYVHLPCKYLVASAPATAILLARLVMRTATGLRFMTWVTVSAGILLGLLIIAADDQFAAIGKRVATEHIAPRVAKGIRVWANGEWGFEFYALKAGAIPVAKHSPYPSPGDVLVSSSAAPHISLDHFPNRQLIAFIRETSKFGRVMDPSSWVGFYSGFFPWTWRNGEIENVTIWRIQ